jgi:hypothetical protein
MQGLTCTTSRGTNNRFSRGIGVTRQLCLSPIPDFWSRRPEVGSRRSELRSHSELGSPGFTTSKPQLLDDGCLRVSFARQTILRRSVRANRNMIKAGIRSNSPAARFYIAPKFTRLAMMSRSALVAALDWRRLLVGDLPVVPIGRSRLSLVTSGKSLALLRASPARHEGRFAIVTNVGPRDAMDACRAHDERMIRRTAKSWRPDISTLVSTLGKLSLLRGMVARKPDHQGDHEGNR